MEVENRIVRPGQSKTEQYRTNKKNRRLKYSVTLYNQSCILTPSMHRLYTLTKIYLPDRNKISQRRKGWTMERELRLGESIDQKIKAAGARVDSSKAR